MWSGQVKAQADSTVVRSKVWVSCGVSVAGTFPKRSVGQDVVKLSRLLRWAVICDDVSFRLVEVCVSKNEALASSPGCEPV